MEWLKRLLGEDLYNRLPQEIIEKFGQTEWVENDPTKIIPKHVFNEKLSKIKLLETEVEQYKTQLNSYGEMVTNQDMKQKIKAMEIDFEKREKEQKEQFEKEIKNNNTVHLLKENLLSAGMKPNYVDMFVKNINPEEAIIDNGKLLNGEKLILPLKENYKEAFGMKITGQTPPANNGSTPPRKTTKQELIDKYNEAEKSGNYGILQSIQRQIKSLEE